MNIQHLQNMYTVYLLRAMCITSLSLQSPVDSVQIVMFVCRKRRKLSRTVAYYIEYGIFS